MRTKLQTMSKFFNGHILKPNSKEREREREREIKKNIYNKISKL